MEIWKVLFREPRLSQCFENLRYLYCMNTILVVGGGSIGKRHTRNLLSLGEKNIILVETNALRIPELAREFGITVVSSIEEAWEKENFNISFICSPSVYHLSQARYCAERGSDLFIEKPLAHTFEGLKDLEKMVNEKKLITMVGSNWKFYPLFQKMKEWLDSQSIGRVLSVRCQFGQYLPDWHPWEDHKQGYSANKKLGGGVLLDSHEFDYLTWFMDKPVQKISCFLDRVGDVTVDSEDTAEVILKFEDKAIGEIHLDYLQRFYQRNFEFFGETGTLTWDAPLKKVTLRITEGQHIEEVLSEKYDVNQMYLDEVQHFLKSVNERKETVTPLHKGIEIIRLISAARESAETERVIHL